MILSTKDRGKKWLQGGWKDEAEVIGGEWSREGEDVYSGGRLSGGKLKEGLEGLREVVDSVPKI